MKVLVLGGDGFCGWPTALHLSARGWDVIVVDNLSRRNIDNELEVQSLTPIRTMGERIAAWKAWVCIRVAMASVSWISPPAPASWRLSTSKISGCRI